MNSDFMLSLGVIFRLKKMGLFCILKICLAGKYAPKMATKRECY